MPVPAESIPRLTPSQAHAIAHARAMATAREQTVRDGMTRLLAATGCPAQRLDAARAAVRRHARVVVHFHPDRLGPDGRTVAESLLDGGRYASQFSTGLSSGSRTAFPGGARDAWERVLFGGAYHGPAVAPVDRPVYGALELVRHPDGPWPRFGSCHLVLRTPLLARSTFTFAGSEQPDAVDRLGTIDHLDAVILPLLEEVARGDGTRTPWPPWWAPTLGVPGLTVPGLLDRLITALPLPRPGDALRPPGRVLDSGIEAQVHGPVMMASDVELVVADPAFTATPTGEVLRAIVRRLGMPLVWHPGFRLAANDVPAGFRGPAVAALARGIAIDGMVDAAVIGAAEASLHHDPDRWRDVGSPDEMRQLLKQLWHVLVHDGAPAAT